MPCLKTAERIKTAILNKYTYEQMEEKSGLKINTLKRITSGKRDVQLDELKIIANYTGTSVIHLIVGSVLSDKDIEKIEPENGYETQFEKKARLAYMNTMLNLKVLSKKYTYIAEKVITGLVMVETANKCQTNEEAQEREEEKLRDLIDYEQYVQKQGFNSIEEYEAYKQQESEANYIAEQEYYR